MRLLSKLRTSKGKQRRKSGALQPQREVLTTANSGGGGALRVTVSTALCEQRHQLRSASSGFSYTLRAVAALSALSVRAAALAASLRAAASNGVRGGARLRAATKTTSRCEPWRR
eukprot:2383402-Pleurochrysis_carterae.AAC.1